MLNKFKYIIFAVILFLCFNITDLSAYSFDNTIKVYDYAQVLNDKEESTLKEEVNEYINKYNIDMVIVLVKYYNYDSLSTYLNEFYVKNSFGLSYDNKGIILVIDVKDDGAYIKTFGNVSALYNSSEIDNILSLVKKKNHYYDKAHTFIEYSNEYAIKDIVSENKRIDLLSINFAIILLPSVLIPTVLVIIILSQNKSSKKDIDPKEEIIVINKKVDKFITTNTKQINK